MQTRKVLWLAISALICGAAVWLFLDARETWPRGEALDSALRLIAEEKANPRSMVAHTILANYQETHQNASRWSGLYWGFTWLATALSALAGFILKVESFLKNESEKKDLAALFAVLAAILVAVATGGDFQRKWQANRV